MSQLWKAGWRGLALLSGVLLILVAGDVVRSRAPRAPRDLARSTADLRAHPRALPLPQPTASLDQADPAPGYQAALWSGTEQKDATVVSARVGLVEIPVPYAVHTVFDPSIALGVDVVAAKGQPGQAVEAVRKIYQGSKVVSVAIVGEHLVRAPSDEIVHVGAKLPEVSRGQLLGRVTGSLQVSATAYWADPGWSNGRTATGVPARYGVVAVDPGVIPLGERLYIPGYGYGVAADTGGAIVGDRIDLCFDTEQQAMAWGRQAVTIYELGSN